MTDDKHTNAIMIIAAVVILASAIGVGVYLSENQAMSWSECDIEDLGCTDGQHYYLITAKETGRMFCRDGGHNIPVRDENGTVFNGAHPKDVEKGHTYLVYMPESKKMTNAIVRY